ncbi:MAG: UDP-N-acetylglucosamine 2-epimerase (non-hydrolyzing) [Acidimicrobiales bacterium]|nr:UDP-N-acetylglucosamine 2-epimerase (non-hydrolyzing) [Acidimicrobiales bacterium]MDG1846424.1 UDP-N-acetylglucosamine 2-epimerase (non-hydrolyzing) [Acidimicrobiales bacterium]
MKILSVVGARPQFIKLAPLHKAAVRRGLNHQVIHTGQHYDDNMSEVFFRELEMPKPDLNLNVGSGSHAFQTAQMMEGIETCLLEEKPDWVIAYGDTNSTLAAAIVAVKIHIPIAHVEAGLRSGNREMPEEHNRIITDHCSDLLFAPTETAMKNLAHEGLKQRSRLVGDIMVDSLDFVQETLLNSPIDVQKLCNTQEEFILATIHRAENTGDASRLESLIEILSSFHIPVVLPAHPRLVSFCKKFNIELSRGSLKIIPPLSHRELIATARTSRSVITDSGGLQKESFLLKVPCSTIRTETEWEETLVGGWNIIVDDLSNLEALAMRTKPLPAEEAPFGSGDTAGNIIDCLLA